MLNFQDLRAINMTTHKRAQAAIPHQGYKPSICPASFLHPAERRFPKQSVGRGNNMEKPSWNCACI